MSKLRPFVKACGLAAAAALVLVLVAGTSSAQALSPEVLKAFSFRSIGPTHQSGRFVDIAVPPLEPWTIYAATGSGGLWKSVNNGETWEPIFDNQSVISIGDIAVSASNPSVVYVGTGESTSSRSTYWGDGVYKSTDGGKTWANVGLNDSQHIGRIVIHPTNPDIVYVAALGHLYSQNDERGVYKTIDGGKTWTKSLEVKADGRMVGASDIVMDPKKPEILYAAAYDKERKPWTFNLGGPGGGIYKTVDAGKTWTKLAGGLPGGMLGRIGLDISLKNPLVLYANIENANKPKMSDADRLAELRAGKSSAGMIGEEVYRTDDGGKTWKKVNEKNPVGGGPGYYYMNIRVDPNDVNHAYVLTVGVLETKDGGKTWASAFRFGGDNHALWIDPANSKHMILGYDHGMGITFDGGKSWHHPDQLPLAQIYGVGYDNQVPYNVYGGLQDNGSVRGPSSRRAGRAIVFEDWQTVGGGDGQFNVMDTVTNRYLYNEYQFGAITRTDLYTGEAKGIQYADDTLRHNWTAPIVVSAHDPNVIYHAANRVLKSTSRGDNWEFVSPDLTTNDKTKLTVDGKGGDGNIEYCTISTLSESPLAPGLLWAGTDDGNVWVTKDGGKNWAKLNDNVKGNPGYWVSRIEASHHFPGTAYLTYTGFRNDDFRPFVYKTTDYGQTWTSIVANLPNKSINVIREDPKNPNLLFVGAEFGLFVSTDGGRSWSDFHGNMPTQPVWDLAIQPRDGELIVGTHGRGFFITDIAPLEQSSDSVLGESLYLFDPKPAVKWVTRPEHVMATTNYAGQSNQDGLVITYFQKAAASGDVTVQILQGARVVAENEKAPNAAGFNKLVWNLRMDAVTIPGVPVAPQRGRGFGGGRPGQAQPAIPTFGGSVPALPGEYTIVVSAGGRTISKRAVVVDDVWFDKVF